MLKRLHIVGCPRSGTTLLMELMSTCFDHDGFCEHEISIFEKIQLSEGLYISKKPSDIKNIQHIYPRDPNLHIIYLVRDPRAVISSKHHSNPNQYFCNYKAWRQCHIAAKQYQRNGKHYDKQRFLQITYEELTTNPNHIQLKIIKKFPFLVRKHLFSDFEKKASPSISSLGAMNGLRPISTNSIDSWKNHLPRIKEQLERHPSMASDLIQLEYEKNNDWKKILSEVESTVYPCRYTEDKARLKELEKSIRMFFRSLRYLKDIKKNAAP